MLKALAEFAARVPRGVIGVLLALAVLWLVAVFFWPLVYFAAVCGLVIATFIIAGPEVAMLRGSGDPRPWLVRIREHHWGRVQVPGVGELTRPAAYVALVAGWWLLLR